MIDTDTDTRTEQLPPQPPGAGSGHSRLAPADTHRLALQAKLTEIGVPPAPEDRGALRQLSELDAGSVGAVVRWLACAASASDVPGDTSPQPQPAVPQRAAQAPVVRLPVARVRAARVLPVPDSAARIDPRLLTW